MDLTHFTKEQLKEMPLVEVAYYYIKTEKKTIQFLDLIEALKQLVDKTDAEMTNSLAQFYTDMNVDGRFLFKADEGWGLRSWYPSDQIKEETATVIRVKKKKKKKSEDDFDDYDELVEEEYIDEEDLEEEDEDDDEAESDESLDIVLPDDDSELDDGLATDAVEEDVEFENFEDVADELIDEDEYDVDEEFDELSDEEKDK